MEKIIDFQQEFNDSNSPDFSMTAEHGLFLPEYRPVFSKSFEKHAGNVYVPSRIQDYISKLKPRPDEGRYVHIIALGASEHWGPNRKGDSFPKWSLLSEAPPETLVHTLKGNADARIRNIPSRSKYGLSTFETTPAYVFRNHKNSNPRYTTGEPVPCAAYNEKMERVELIVFIKNSLAPEIIRQIDAGDPIAWSMGCRVPFDVCFTENALVETIDGLVPIKDVTKGTKVLTHTGKAYQPALAKSMRDYKGVLHKIQVHGSYKELECTHNHPFYVLKETEVHQPAGRRRELHQLTKDPEWVPAEDLSVGDYVLYPISRDEKAAFPGDFELARLSGYYTGDGHLIIQGSHRDKQGPKKTMGVVLTTAYTELDHKESYLDLVASFGGNEANVYESGDNKKAYQIHWYDQERAKFLEANVGRGCRSKRIPDFIWNSRDEVKYAFLGAYIDCDGSQDNKKGSVRLCSVNEGLALGCTHLLRSLGIPASIHVETVVTSYSENTDKVYVVFIPASATKMLSKYSTKVSPVDIKHSSTVGFKWRNYLCFPITKINKEATEDTPVYNLEIANDNSYVVDGVTVHNCSICGHVARTTRDYCEHTRHGGLGSFDRETGRRVSVYNYFPTFFDISHVFIPADRSAFMLQKVAGANDHRPILSINIPFSKQAGKKKAMIKKTVPLDGPTTDLGIDPLDPKEVKESKKLVADDKNKREIPKEFLEKLKNLFGGVASTKAMTSAGIVMKPREASTLLGGGRMGRGSGPLSELPGGLMRMIGGLIGGRSMFRSAVEPRVKRIRIIIMSKKPEAAAAPNADDSKIISLKNLKKSDKKMSKSASSYYQWLEGLDPKEVWDSAVENSVIDKLDTNFFAEKIASIYVESEPKHNLGFFLPFIMEVERLKENF